jgi:hypothetical protein
MYKWQITYWNGDVKATDTIEGNSYSEALAHFVETSNPLVIYSVIRV